MLNFHLFFVFVVVHVAEPFVYIISIITMNILTLSESLMLAFYSFFILLAADQASTFRILKYFPVCCIHDSRYLKLYIMLMSLVSGFLWYVYGGYCLYRITVKSYSVCLVEICNFRSLIHIIASRISYI